MTRTAQWIFNIFLLLFMISFFASCKMNEPRQLLAYTHARAISSMNISGSMDKVYTRLCQLELDIADGDPIESDTDGIKFIPEGGFVGVSTYTPPCNHIWVESFDDTVYNEVSSDNGITLDWDYPIFYQRIYTEDTHEYEDDISLVCLRCQKEKKRVIHTLYKKNVWQATVIPLSIMSINTSTTPFAVSQCEEDCYTDNSY